MESQYRAVNTPQTADPETVVIVDVAEEEVLTVDDITTTEESVDHLKGMARRKVTKIMTSLKQTRSQEDHTEDVDVVVEDTVVEEATEEEVDTADAPEVMKDLVTTTKMKGVNMNMEIQRAEMNKEKEEEILDVSEDDQDVHRHKALVMKVNVVNTVNETARATEKDVTMVNMKVVVVAVEDDQEETTDHANQRATAKEEHLKVVPTRNTMIHLLPLLTKHHLLKLKA